MSQTLLGLPDSLLGEIARKLEPLSKLLLSQTCHTWRALLSTEPGINGPVFIALSGNSGNLTPRIVETINLEKLCEGRTLSIELPADTEGAGAQVAAWVARRLPSLSEVRIGPKAAQGPSIDSFLSAPHLFDAEQEPLLAAGADAVVGALKASPTPWGGQLRLSLIRVDLNDPFDSPNARLLASVCDAAAANPSMLIHLEVGRFVVSDSPTGTDRPDEPRLIDTLRKLVHLGSLRSLGVEDFSRSNEALHSPSGINQVMLSRLPNLTSLEVGGTYIDEEEPRPSPNLSLLPSLRRLVMSHDILASPGTMLSSIAALTNLKELYFGDLEPTGLAHLTHLNSLSALTSLWLSLVHHLDTETGPLPIPHLTLPNLVQLGFDIQVLGMEAADGGYQLHPISMTPLFKSVRHLASVQTVHIEILDYFHAGPGEPPIVRSSFDVGPSLQYLPPGLSELRIGLVGKSLLSIGRGLQSLSSLRRVTFQGSQRASLDICLGSLRDIPQGLQQVPAHVKFAPSGFLVAFGSVIGSCESSSSYSYLTDRLTIPPRATLTHGLEGSVAHAAQSLLAPVTSWEETMAGSLAIAMLLAGSGGSDSAEPAGPPAGNAVGNGS